VRKTFRAHFRQACIYFYFEIDVLMSKALHRRLCITTILNDDDDDDD